MHYVNHEKSKYRDACQGTSTARTSQAVCACHLPTLLCRPFGWWRRPQLNGPGTPSVVWMVDHSARMPQVREFCLFYYPVGVSGGVVSDFAVGDIPNQVRPNRHVTSSVEAEPAAACASGKRQVGAKPHGPQRPGVHQRQLQTPRTCFSMSCSRYSPPTARLIRTGAAAARAPHAPFVLASPRDDVRRGG